jgi:hypothetical protein
VSDTRLELDRPYQTRQSLAVPAKNASTVLPARLHY